MTKLMMVSGMVTVTAALAIGHRFLAISFHVDAAPLRARLGSAER